MRLLQSLLVLLLFLSGQTYALTAIPAYSQRVVDTTTTLTTSQISDLENKLSAYETTANNGSQIAVLLIATLDGEPIEQYAQRVFTAWQIGQKGQDNGILLLIAKDDREVRIEVGYGLEGDIPDLLAKRIISQAMIPQFSQNNYYQGIDNALAAIINTLNRTQTDQDLANDMSSVQDVFNSDFGPVLFNYAGLSFFICLLIGRLLPFAALKKSTGKRSLVTGVLNTVSTGGFTLANGLSMSVLLPILFLTFVVSTILCGIFSVGRSGGGSYRGPRGGGSGGFGGSRGGFGGGGGGRSGGGGASGRW